MAKKTKDIVKETEEYLEFLKKRLESKNYKSNVTKEEYEQHQKLLDKFSEINRQNLHPEEEDDI